MKLLRLGMKNLSSKSKSIISLIWKNCKLELLIVVSGILWINQSWHIPNIGQILAEYFDESRCSGISGFASIIIGIYITVWSIFATSASKINEELLKNRVEGQLFLLIGVDLTAAFITTAWCVFIPSDIPHYTNIMVLFTVLTAISFIKFLILILMITKLNIKYIVQEIDENNAKCTEAQVKLDEIYQHAVYEKDSTSKRRLQQTEKKRIK